MSNTTNVVGYYNGSRWPIQLVISKLNITLTLEPGRYIEDRSGRKINDPYFEVYANNKQLHRELSTTPVPIVSVPAITAATPPAQAANPVHAVTEWTRDDKGMRRPVLTPKPPVAPAVPFVESTSNDSVRPMSIEEARRAGYVRKTRDVPEDYGVTDTTGLPPSGIPKMKYAIDPTVNRTVNPLPKELLNMPKDDPNRPARSQLVNQLVRVPRTPAPEDASANPFGNTSVVNAPPDSQIVAGTNLNENVEPESPEEQTSVEPETEPVSLPEPDLSELSPEPAPVPAAPPLRQITPKNQFVCMGCNAPFKFRSQLLNHAKAKHADRINAIMAPYPDTPTLP